MNVFIYYQDEFSYLCAVTANGNRLHAENGEAAPDFYKRVIAWVDTEFLDDAILHRLSVGTANHYSTLLLSEAIKVLSAGAVSRACKAVVAHRNEAIMRATETPATADVNGLQAHAIAARDAAIAAHDAAKTARENAKTARLQAREAGKAAKKVRPTLESLEKLAAESAAKVGKVYPIQTRNGGAVFALLISVVIDRKRLQAMYRFREVSPATGGFVENPKPKYLHKALTTWLVANKALTEMAAALAEAEKSAPETAKKLQIINGKIARLAIKIATLKSAAEKLAHEAAAAAVIV